MSAAWPKLERGIVAILRGLAPHEATAIGRAVFEPASRRSRCR